MGEANAATALLVVKCVCERTRGVDCCLIGAMVVIVVGDGGEVVVVVWGYPLK